MGGFNLDTKNANGTHRLQAQHPFDGGRHATSSTTSRTTTGSSITPRPPIPTHARPSSLQAIGYSFEPDGKTRDPANHEYDLHDFYDAVKAGNFPAVSFIKLPAYQDGHAGYSDPLDEQAGTVSADQLPEQQPDWKRHRGDHHLGRFRRLVRPRLRQADERVVRSRGRPARRPRQVRHRHAAARASRASRSTAAAVPARACRSW